MKPPKISDPVKTHVLHWDRFKGTLKEKYVYENMTLQQVKEYMCSTHGFEASVGQYQRRFKEWKYFKNNKRKDCEDIILSAKRIKLDCDNLDLKGLPNAVQSRFQRALRRYDIPGLQYRRLLERSSDEHASTSGLNNKTNSTCLTVWRSQTCASDSLQLKQRNEPVGQCIEVLPIFLFTSNFQRESIRIIKILPTRAQNVLQRYLGPVQSTLGQRSEASCDSIKDTEILWGNRPLTKLEVAMATMVYQVSNYLSDDSELFRLLCSTVIRAETMLSPILTSKLQTAKAFSQRILLVLFKYVPPNETLSGNFRSTFELLLQTKINVNVTIKSSRSLVAGAPTKMSLLQHSLSFGHLDVAMRLLQAGGNSRWCAEHSGIELVDRMSCCGLHPMVLMVEKPYESFRKQNEYDIGDLLEVVEKSGVEYPKDISMTKITHKHSVMQSLLNHGVEPDSMMSLWDEKHTVAKVWYTALQCAVDRRDKKATSMLLKAGANPSGCSYKTFARYLETRKASAGGNGSETKLRTAAHRMLASASAMTPLAIACLVKDLEMVQLLLHAGASINGCQFDFCCKGTHSHERNDPACHRCHQGYSEHDSVAHAPHHVLAALDSVIKKPSYLYGFSFSARVDYIGGEGFKPILGCAPLQTAVLALDHKTVRHLLSHSANVEGCHGLTPLALAVCKQSVSLIKMLLESGADPFGFTQYGPCVSAVAVAALTTNVRTMELLLENNPRQRSMDREEVLSPWTAALRSRWVGGYRRLRKAMREGQLVEYPSSMVDMFEAMLYFDGEFSYRVPCWARTLALDPGQADGSRLLKYCLKGNYIVTLRVLLDLGVNANSADVLATGLLRTSSSWMAQSKGLDILLEETYGVSSLTAIEALQMLRTEVSSNPDLSIRVSIRKLMYRWPTMKPSPGGAEVYAMLRVLLSDDFFIHNFVTPQRPCQTGVCFQEDVCDLILFVLDEVGRYSEHRIDEYEETPIQAAAHMAKFDIVSALIKVGADVNASAATTRNLNRKLLDAKTEAFPRTALQYAVENIDVSMVKLLLDHGADVNAPGSKMVGPTALQIAVRKAEQSMVMLLLDRGANVNEPGSNTFGRDALQFAIEDGNCDIVQLLLKAGADVNGPCSNAHGRTALQLAVEKKNDELLKLLLEKGADVNRPGAPHFGRTALQLASEVADAELVKQLINYGADVNWPAAHCGGVTALQAAAIRGSFHICRLLVDAGADVNADGSDIEGRTAIEGAAEHGRLDILTWLLHQSAKQFRNQLRDDGDLQLLHAARSASALAKEEGMYHIVDFLDSYMMGLEEGMKKKTPPASNSPRTSDRTRPTQPEPNHGPADPDIVTTSPATILDPEMRRVLIDTAAVASKEFSNWLEEFVNTDMFE